MPPKSQALPNAAAIYCRISQDDGAALGVKRQEKDCRELAERRGWPVGHVYVDNDISAYKSRRRPEYEAMLEDIRDGRIDAVIVYDLDRLTRRPREIEDFIDLCGAAAVRMACVSGDIDLSDENGRLQARLVGAFARKESDAKSRRIKRKHLEIAQSGRHPGSWSMLGYEYRKETKSLAIVADEARVIRRVFQDYADGVALREIARDLNARGIVGKRGRTKWTHGAITRLLDNPTYTGLRVYEGETYEATTWTAIVKRDLWDRVRARRLAERADTPAQNRTGKGTTMLSGLLFCPCGAPMWRDSYKSKPNKSSYLCSDAKRRDRGQCRAGGIAAHRAEAMIADAFLAHMSEPYSERASRENVGGLLDESGPRVDDLDARIARIESQMERLITMELDSDVPLESATIRRKKVALQDEHQKLERQRAALISSGSSTRRRADDLARLRKRLGSLPHIWELATSTERNEMLKLVIERATVTGIGRGKSVDIQWARWLDVEPAA
ncbi:MAG TPA: recombinase family protein [Actinomycetota bacterium]|nr:recombinase family protein [Actinomycetota bacterium]